MKYKTTNVSAYWRNGGKVIPYKRSGIIVSDYTRGGHYVGQHPRRYMGEGFDLNALLTTGIPIKHQVTVELTPKDRSTLIGTVSILAGAAIFAVMLARR